MKSYELSKQELQLTALWAWCRNNPESSFSEFCRAEMRASSLADKEMDKQRARQDSGLEGAK